MSNNYTSILIKVRRGREGGRERGEGEGDQFNEWLSLGPPLPDLSLEIDFTAKELRSHTNHVISAQQLM